METLRREGGEEDVRERLVAGERRRGFGVFAFAMAFATRGGRRREFEGTRFLGVFVHVCGECCDP